MVNILFVCSANRFRSVVATECFKTLILKNQAVGNWTVESAGIWAKNGLPPIPQALKYAKTKGLEMDHIRSKEVNRTLLAEADLIVVMTESQREAIDLDFPQEKERVMLLSEVCEGQKYDIPDPLEKVDETTEALGEEICSLISRGFNHIIEVAAAMKNH